mgnify:CR=1 FL=1
MTKAELIDAVVKKTEMTKKDAGRAIDAIFETIKEELSKEALKYVVVKPE